VVFGHRERVQLPSRARPPNAQQRLLGETDQTANPPSHGLELPARTRAHSDEELVASWLAGMNSAVTRANFAATAERFLAHLAAHGLTLRSATVQDVRDVIAALAQGKTASTATQYAQRVKSLLSYAHKLGYTPFNAGPCGEAGPDAPMFRSHKGGAQLYPRAVNRMIKRAAERDGALGSGMPTPAMLLGTARRGRGPRHARPCERGNHIRLPAREPRSVIRARARRRIFR
jgi:hypothetical protein